jgi:hypothetical protein
LRSIAHFFSNRQLRSHSSAATSDSALVDSSPSPLDDMIDARKDAAEAAASVDPASAVRHAQPELGAVRGEFAELAEAPADRGRVQDDLAPAFALTTEQGSLRGRDQRSANHAGSGAGHDHFYRVRRDMWAIQRAEREARVAAHNPLQLERVVDDLLLSLRVAIDDLYHLTDAGLERAVGESRSPLSDDFQRGREFLRRTR